MRASNEDEDYFQRPNNPSELTTNEHLFSFFMLYLKEMKNECIEVLLHPVCSKFLKEKETSAEELFNLNDDDYVKFKELFQANKVSIAHNDCTDKMNELYSFIIDIMTKRVTIDQPSVKVDQIINKLVLIDIPEGINHESSVEKVMQPVQASGEGAEEGSQPPAEGQEPAMQEVEIKKEKNTDEKAVIIIKVPQIEEEEEIKVEVSGSEGQKTEIIKKMVDEDQKDSAIVIQGRDVQGIRIQEAKQFYNINQYAGKAYREDFMNFIAKQFPEFFDDNDDFDKIIAEAHRLADKDIAQFIKNTCGEYEMPCLEFEVHAPDIN